MTTPQHKNKKCKIYHYCPCWAFENIIRTKELWFSSEQNSNDAIEFKIPELVLQQLKYDPILQPKLSFIDSCISYLQEQRKNFFTMSFSLGEDQLSQWRSYADDGRGFAIGTEVSLSYIKDFSQTPNIQKNSPFVFMQVAYNNVSDLKDNFLYRLKKIHTQSEENQFKQDLLYYAVASKYCQFYEEKEVRLVCLNPKTTKMRLSPYGTRPYITYPLDKTQELNIMIGPKNKCTVEEIKKFLQTHEFNNVTVLPAIQHYK